MAHTFNNQNAHCVITLNGRWVPRLVVGHVDIVLRAGGRFSVEGSLNWPLFHPHTCSYLALIPRMSRPSRWAAVLW
jgi:hypothetical protein